ncbi:MAG: hypothetical protein EOP81_02240 [Variovorax sp.]|nr:MAG: hypothetical protein EOP81_02240 [Variovorax sp.]
MNAQTEPEPQTESAAPATEVASTDVWRGLGSMPAPVAPAEDQHVPPELAPVLAGGVLEEAIAAGEAAKARTSALPRSQQDKQKAADEVVRRKVEIRGRSMRLANLIAARRLAGFDQEEAACRAGYANSTPLCLLESGARELRLDHVVKFSEVYGVSTDFLLGRASSESEIEVRTSVAGRVLDGIKTVADALMQHVEASDKFTGGSALPRYRALLEHARSVMSAARRVDGPALHSIVGGGTLAFAIEQLEEALVEGARAVAGHEGELQHLRELLCAPAANDGQQLEKNG